MVARMYHMLFQQMRKQLGQLDAWLTAARSHAETRKFDPNLFLQTRLAPDQFPLVRQVQIACDTAKLGVARITGKAAPEHPDTEATIEDLAGRVRAVMAYLEALSASDFANAATATVTQPRWEGKTMAGADYFVEHVVPNFFFHLTTTYALLRHNGVPLGKKDYLGKLTQKLPG